jgi:hypothetical protein
VDEKCRKRKDGRNMLSENEKQIKEGRNKGKKGA